MKRDISHMNLRWILDNAEDMIQSFLKNGQFFDRQQLDIMANYIKEGDIIIDIGANVGNHTVFFSKFTKAKLIYSIEPVDRCYKMLLCNIALNYCHNVNVDYIGVGLGNHECIAYPFTVYGKNNLGSTRMFDTPNPESFIEDNRRTFNEDPDRYTPVQIIRGDSIFSDKKIDFIKVDAEGMDLVILEGLKETISKNRPKIFIEIINDSHEDFLKWVSDNNYKIEHEISHDVYNPDDPYSGKNYLILPQ